LNRFTFALEIFDDWMAYNAWMFAALIIGYSYGDLTIPEWSKSFIAINAIGYFGIIHVLLHGNEPDFDLKKGERP